jgi:hypothetical protein
MQDDRIGIMCRYWFLLCVFALVLEAKDPTEWMSGKLINVSTTSESRVQGVNGIVNTRIRTVFTFSVDGGDKVYEAQEKGKRAPHVEVNSPIPYSVTKDYLFVRDADGKVHKLALIKTTRKE